MASKKQREVAIAIFDADTPKVVLPPTFIARINQMAHREGKAHADMWRTTTTASLKTMADQGASIEELSAALATIEKGPAEALAEGYMQRKGAPE